MLTAVSYVGTRRGPHLVGFYACIYYAMMRPSEVIKLQRSQCELPDDGGWGRLILQGAAPEVGAECTDDGTTHDKRGLKDAAPCHPPCPDPAAPGRTAQGPYRPVRDRRRRPLVPHPHRRLHRR
ncbi:hypothetical protein GCM10029992_37300 [Glycomyces albus]